MTIEVQQGLGKYLSDIYAISIDAPNIMRIVSNLNIADQIGCNLALSWFGRVKDRLNQLEQLRKDLNEPHRKQVNAINSAAKEVEAQLKEIATCLTAKLAIWQKELESRSEQRREAAKILTDSLGIEMSVFVESPKTLSNQDAIASTKIKIGFELENIELVPREYLMLDEDKIKKAIKMGVNIPGIKIIETKELQVRKR